MSLKFANVVGIPSETAWSNVFTKHQEGTAVCAVISATTTNPAVDGRKFLQELEAAFRDSFTDSTFLSLFQAPIPEHLEVAALFLTGDTAYVFGNGAGIYMRRDSGGSFVVPPGSPMAPMKGAVQHGDFIVVATADFFKTYQSQMETGVHPERLADELAAAMRSLPVSGTYAAGFLSLADEEEQETAPPAPEPPSAIEHPEAVPLPRVSPVLPVEGLDPHHSKRKGHRRVRSVQIRNLIIALLVIGALIGGVVFLTQRLAANRANAITTTLAPYQHKLQEVQAMPGEERVQSLQMLQSIQADLDRLEKERGKDRAFMVKLSELRSQLQSVYQERSGERQVGKLQVYYDFRLIAQDFQATAVGHDISGKLAIFLDGDHSRMMSLSLEKKQAQVLSVDEQIKKPFALSVSDRKAYVLGETGILQISLPLDTAGKVIVPRSDLWQTPKFVSSFGSNVYMLDSGQRNLYRYDLAEPDASPSGWFRSKEGVDFEKLTSTTIDGDVWLTTSQGEIFRFTRGERRSFALTQVLQPPSSSVVLYTDEASPNLYVLEPRAKRILVTSKDGAYQSTIVSDDLSTATSLIVDESQNKAFVLAGSLVYEVPLK